jgi:hypothetical protein
MTRALANVGFYLSPHEHFGPPPVPAVHARGTLETVAAAAGRGSFWRRRLLCACQRVR